MVHEAIMMGGWLLGGLLMVLFWGAVIALIVWAVRAFARTQSVQSRTGVDYEPRGSDRTLRIAQERYARRDHAGTV
jgi:uncharacterized membrane protein